MAVIIGIFVFVFIGLWIESYEQLQKQKQQKILEAMHRKRMKQEAKHEIDSKYPYRKPFIWFLVAVFIAICIVLFNK